MLWKYRPEGIESVPRNVEAGNCTTHPALCIAHSKGLDSAPSLHPWLGHWEPVSDCTKGTAAINTPSIAYWDRGEEAAVLYRSTVQGVWGSGQLMLKSAVGVLSLYLQHGFLPANPEGFIPPSAELYNRMTNIRLLIGR